MNKNALASTELHEGVERRVCEPLEDPGVWDNVLTVSVDNDLRRSSSMNNKKVF